MLHDFLTSNRTELIERCRVKAVRRLAPEGAPEPLVHGIPGFLDQVIKTLLVEQSAEPMQSRSVSGPSGGGNSGMSEIGITARRHGRELLRHGYTVDQVVHDYGDLCQAITDLAFRDHVPIEVDEFRTLNRCLDNAIAESVSEFAYDRDLEVADRNAEWFHERLGIFAHELRDLISTATYALAAIKTGQVGLGGPTGAVLNRSLTGLRNLVDRSLAEARLRAPMPAHHPLISVADLIHDIELSGSLEAESHACAFRVSEVDPSLAVEADREMLSSAVANLLQNAFKFTAHGTEVSMTVRATADRVLIEVEDRCGGLPPGDAERLFKPFTQSGTDKSGAGLGLTICRRSVEANHGILSVRNVPGTGCVFMIDLARHSLGERFFRA